MKYKLFSLLTASIIFPIVYAQTGPGGVGSNNGSSNLVLWLDANKENGTNGSIATTWSDQSGYNHNFSSSNGAFLMLLL